ncbi:type II toxin-antitoxin system MqsA family antitoxin [Ectothiorhodospira shaposhnikovii]|uniref:type II toxin-antitoxin system MqsA family antitoxin n=1 Tax=Ectothiorhodospira shaposhnikovii TaxID=1054 RepID=UPI001EE7F759|nr:type II toxin-antitoxin system MqsA family antitoxin [Ectothiorhodospira shaposhnikovii]MCG5513998.1 type II toxin-antitoxin system MqsA family antitoxin [Ectothiorhodospira shaposhnikovii]
MATQSEQQRVCPVCGEGSLEQRIDTHIVEHAGVRGSVPLYLAQCAACGSELAPATEAKMNKRAVITFRKRVDGLLTGAEMRAARASMGLTQAQAAALFGGGKVAFSRYENDDVTQSEAMDSLIRLCLSQPANLRELARRKGVVLPGEARNAGKLFDSLLTRNLRDIKHSLDVQLGLGSSEVRHAQPPHTQPSVSTIQAWWKRVA